MSEASTHNDASTSQPATSNQMTGGGSGNAAAVASSNVSSMANTPSTNIASTAATSFTTSTIPSNPSSGTTTNSTNSTTNISGSNITVPISSTMAQQRETSINNNTSTTTTSTMTAAASTTTTTTTNPSGNVTTATSATVNRAVPIVKKTKKRIKDTSTGKETNDSSGNPVKKKVRKVNRNSSGGTGPNSTGRGSHPGNTGTNATTTNTSGGGITNHHNHPNMPSIHHNGLIVHDGLSAAQQAAQEQMRRALEEDQYSLVGSIIDHNNDSDNNYDDDTTDDGDRPYTNYTYNYRGSAVRLDKAAMIQAVRKYILLEQRLQQQQQNTTGTTLMSNGIMEEHGNIDDDDDDDEMYGMEDDDDDVGYGSNPGDARRGGVPGHNGNSTNHNHRTTSNGNNKKKKRKDELTQLQDDVKSQHQQPLVSKDPMSLDPDDDLDRDGGSIFGATTGQSNSTWVECDKCKKWRRLRGVVDEKKLPSKWYCSMNKNDPERARCSAPEEEYETSHTPESAADSRTRKHLRVWVRRLQCNEAYESRQPTLTRGKKRNAVSSSSTNPYEWVRCCNPSCGKWRALLRIMDAKGNVVDRTNDGEWYCVMNNWDEKMASCAAPQENLPAVGCPPWVLQDGK